MRFDELGLSEKVLDAVKASGYETPTPIQEQAIPYALQGRDVLGIAQTGTGKTAAFTLPMLSALEKGRARARMPRTLILEPTRELAAQVEEAFGKYGINHKLNLALLIGGVSFSEQEAKITRGADVLIATPGRLLDFADRGKILLNGIEILVIDEADRMLDMGFIPDIERICKLVPFTRQTLFFSATMPPEITRLTEAFLHNPVRVEVSRAASTAEGIAQTLVRSGASPEEKRTTLRRVIRSAENFKNALIFCNRKRDVQVVYRSLEKHGFSVGALHGDLDQRSRMAALDAFRNDSVQLLVCSDVAARGLDIPDVSHVINYDAPHHSEDYVHRIGRTGRAGKLGVAVTIVTRADARVDRRDREADRPEDRMAGWRGRSCRRTRGSRRSSARASRRPQPSQRRRTRSRRAPFAEPAQREARRRGTRPRGRSHGEPAAHEAPDGGERIRSDRPQVLPAEREAARKPQPRPEEPRRQPRPEAPRRPRRDDEGEARVIGLGDHVPSFLLRPVRLPSKPIPAEAED